MREIAIFTGQFNSCRTVQDGGGKLTLEFGLDSLDAIQKIQAWGCQGATNLIVTVSPAPQANTNDFNSQVEDY